MNYVKLVAQVMGLLNFKNKYGSFVKNQYLSEQITDLVNKMLEIWNPPY